MCVSLVALSPAVYSDRTVLAELLLGLVNLTDEVDEAVAGLRHSLLRPVDELELSQCA